MKFLVAGVSARALAQSAVRAGRRVAALDYFGDRDLSGLAESRSLARIEGTSYDAKALPDLARGMRYDALAYVGNLENHPDVVAALAGNRPIIGNDPDVLRQVRHWPTLRGVCAEEGLRMPPTLFQGEESWASVGVRWLRKPSLGGGGHGIRTWDGAALDANGYLQAYAPGVSASAVFAANGERSVVLSLSEQLIGLPGLGARGFRYCGNITPLSPESGGGPALYEAVRDMVARLTRRFSLRGVCGADFIVTRDRDGACVPTLLEINPRPSASAELLERAGALSVFETHLAAAQGNIPAPSGADPLAPTGGRYYAKAVVFAPWPCVVPESMPDVGALYCDVGEPGDMVWPDKPICCLIARAGNRDAVLQKLHSAARALTRTIRASREAIMANAPMRLGTDQETETL